MYGSEKCDAFLSVIIMQCYTNRILVSPTSLPVIKISDRDCLGDRNPKKKIVSRDLFNELTFGFQRYKVKFSTFFFVDGHLPK
jgi:hypothetical protein